MTKYHLINQNNIDLPINSQEIANFSPEILALVVSFLALSISILMFFRTKPRLNYRAFCRKNKYFPKIIEYKLSIEHYGDYKSRLRSVEFAILKKRRFHTISRNLNERDIEASTNILNFSSKKIEQGDFYPAIFSPKNYRESEILFDLCKKRRVIFIVRHQNGIGDYLYIDTSEIFPALGSNPSVESYLETAPRTKNANGSAK